MRPQITRGVRPVEVGRLLHALPDWFGIDESIAEYMRNAAELGGYTARAGDDAVGVVTIRRRFPQTAEVDVLAVDPAWHRQGVGRGLLATAEAALAGEGVRLVEVKTLGPSHPSEHYARTRRFWSECGYLPVEEFTQLWPGNPCLLMVKALSRPEGR